MKLDRAKFWQWSTLGFWSVALTTAVIGYDITANIICGMFLTIYAFYIA